jgi:hypothetical protein
MACMALTPNRLAFTKETKGVYAAIRNGSLIFDIVDFKVSSNFLFFKLR